MKVGNVEPFPGKELGNERGYQAGETRGQAASLQSLGAALLSGALSGWKTHIPIPLLKTVVHIKAEVREGNWGKPLVPRAKLV